MRLLTLALVCAMHHYAAASRVETFLGTWHPHITGARLQRYGIAHANVYDPRLPGALEDIRIFNATFGQSVAVAVDAVGVEHDGAPGNFIDANVPYRGPYISDDAAVNVIIDYDDNFLRAARALGKVQTFYLRMPHCNSDASAEYGDCVIASLIRAAVDVKRIILFCNNPYHRIVLVVPPHLGTSTARAIKRFAQLKSLRGFAILPFETLRDPQLVDDLQRQYIFPE